MTMNKVLAPVLGAFAVLLCGTMSTALAHNDWLEPTCDVRLRLAVTGDWHVRENCRIEVVLNFSDLLGVERTLEHRSLRLHEADTGRRVKLDMAEDPEILYPSGNPVLRLRWDGGGFAAFARKEWTLYFGTVEPGAPEVRRSLPKTFCSRIPPSVLLDTSFEDADPKRPQWPRDIAPAGGDIKGYKTVRIWTDETARTGKRCLTIKRTVEPDAQWNANNPFWYIRPPAIEIKVREGGIYRASVWIKTTRVKSRKWHANLWFRYLDAEKRRVKGKWMLSRRGPQHACDWTHVSGTLAAPPGSRYMVVGLSLAGDGEVFFDDLTVSKLPGSELPPVEVSIGRLEDRDETAIGVKVPGAEEKKLLKVGLAERPPKLDGVLDDPCWADAGKIPDLMLYQVGSQTDPTRPTTVLACADRDALYLGFVCVEPAGFKPVTEGKGRDGYIWKDDIVEVFLDTNLDRKSFYQIAFNAKSTLFDQDIGVPGLPGESWTGPIEVATKVAKDRWIAELRIGFVGLRLAEAAGNTWTANFCRTSMREGKRTLFTWVEVKRGFGEPSIFGRLLLPLDPTTNAVTARPLLEDRLFHGKGTLPVLVSSRRSRPVRARLSVTAVEKKQARLLGKTAVSIPPGAATVAHVPCFFSTVGALNLRFELHDQPVPKLLYVTSGEYSVPPPLKLNTISSLCYTHEEKLAGTWGIGLSEDALRDSYLVLTVTSGTRPAADALRIVPTRAEGPFALDVSKLPKGRYMLRGELFLGKRQVAEEKLAFERIAGPFSRRE